MKHCKRCKKHIKDNKVFCSNECYHAYPKKNGRNAKKYSKVTVMCENCKVSFDKHPSAIKRSKHNYCSRKCYEAGSNGMAKSTTKYIIKNCFACNKEIKRTESDFKNRPCEKCFCSTECRYSDLKTKKGGFTPIKKECSYCKNIFTITAKNHRKRKYCSKKCKTLAFPSGINHPHFKKELSRDYRSKHRLFYENEIWRKKVFERDNYTCQKCKNKGFKLNAHHIENYAEHKEKRFIVDNGITFCVSCHKAFHSKYGVIKNSKTQLKEFLKK